MDNDARQIVLFNDLLTHSEGDAKTVINSNKFPTIGVPVKYNCDLENKRNLFMSLGVNGSFIIFGLLKVTKQRWVLDEKRNNGSERKNETVKSFEETRGAV